MCHYEYTICDGDIIKFINNTRHYWIAIQHSRCRDSMRYRKHVKDQTGLCLFSCLKDGSNPSSWRSYTKNAGMLKRGMFPNIEIVGNIYNRGDFLKYKDNFTM